MSKLRNGKYWRAYSVPQDRKMKKVSKHFLKTDIAFFTSLTVLIIH